MNDGDRFTSALHQQILKPLGFRKSARTFSRTFDAYSEHFNIQGSAWNSPGEPWTFYVNCAISFPEIPVTSSGSGLWKYHAHTRLRHLVEDSPAEFQVSELNMAEVISEVSGLLARCSDYFQRRHQVIREAYIMKKFEGGFPFDPERNRG